MAIPDDITQIIDQAEALREGERFDDACALLEAAAAKAPQHTPLLMAWADALQDLGRTGEAKDVYQVVLRLHPSHPEATQLNAELTAAEETLLKFAFAADLRNNFEAARENYESALVGNPYSVFVLTRLLTIDGIEGRLADADSHHHQLIDSLRRAKLSDVPWRYLAMVAYQSLFHALPRDLYQAVATALANQLPGELSGWAGGGARLAPPAGRLRIGYLSGSLRDHPIGHVTAGLFAAHDRTRFEVYAFYMPDGGPNPYTDQIRRGVDRFIELSGTATEMADTIATAGLDILVCLDGYMATTLLPVVAARPAPIQLHWLGHAGNCELPAIDYLIADSVVLPPEEEHLYGAKVRRLEGCYHCASPHPIGPPMSRAEAGLPEDGFVFCAFNNPEKIDTVVFASWMRILARVPGSVLWLSRTQSAAIADHLRAAAQAHGIGGERLIFATRLADKAQHLARHRHAGLFLDTLTLNASTTALDALITGLPVLTVTGAHFGARIATSFLYTLGLPELCCATLDVYENEAVRLASDPQDLGRLGGRLMERVASSPLFQINTFCRRWETALTQIAAAHPR